MKRDPMPAEGEHLARWQMLHEVWCGICHQWRKQTESQRQYRTPSPWVFVCNRCFEMSDLKEKRVAPDAVVMQPVQLPPTMRRLWDMDMEND